MVVATAEPFRVTWYFATRESLLAFQARTAPVPVTDEAARPVGAPSGAGGAGGAGTGGGAGAGAAVSTAPRSGVAPQ